jgi:hypothetical protein
MKKSILVLALFSLIVGLTSCQKAEEITVTKYFQAMQHNDKDTMAAMAVEPIAMSFKSFKITSMDEPVIKELELPAFEKKLKELEAQKKEQLTRVLDAADNVEELKYELEETRRRTRKNELEKQIEEAESVAQAEKGMYITLNQQVARMKKKIEAEKNMITSSAGIDSDFGLYTGETHFHKVTVNVVMEDSEPRDYVFLLRKSILKLGDRAMPAGRMIITKIATVEDYEKEMKEEAEKEKQEQQAAPTEEVTETETAEDTTTTEEGGEG